MDVLEYVIRLRGGPAASAEVRGLRSEVNSLSTAQGRLNARSAEAAAAADAQAASVRRNAAGMALLTKASRVGALAIAATTFEAVRMSNTYDTEMLKVRTQAGATSGELAFMKGAVLDLASSGKALGASPTSLAMGLYHLESLGIRGGRALHALTLAAEASAISGANLEETTSALGAAMFVGIKGAGGLDHIIALLNATVGQGNMRMGELVHSLGTGVLSSAKVAGLGINDVMAALALFADAGQDASGAAAQFATALHFFYNPTTKAQSAIASIGMTSDQLAIDMRKPNGMITALSDLRDHLDGLSKVDQAKVLGAILPGGRGRILLTELTMLDRSQQKWDAITKQATSANWQAAVRAQKNNPATMLRIAWAKLEADLVKFGHKVGPVLMPVLIAVTGAVAGLIGLFAEMPAVPVILFVTLLTLGIAALTRRSIAGLVGLTRYALGMDATTVSTEAATVATTELAVAQDAAAASSVGLLGKLGGLATGLMGILRFAGPVGAFLYGLGVFNPDEAGLSPGRERGMLKAAHDHSVKVTGHDSAQVGGHVDKGGITHLSKATMRTYEQYPGMLQQDLANKHGDPLVISQAQTLQLRRWYKAHHRKPPPLLAMGGVARARGAAIVGDDGPEILDLPVGASVTPLRRGGGRGPLLVGGDIVLKVDGRELVRVTRKELLNAQARGG